MREDDVAAFAVFCLFGLPIAGWVFVRFMQHSERMAMIRQGMTPPDPAQKWAQMMGQRGFPDPGDQYAWRHSPQRMLHKGVMLAFIGLALTIGLSFIGYGPYGTFRFGPWLLGGLIPLFVGLAQIFNALFCGATFGQSIGPGRSAQSQAPPSPSGPYAYRPGSTEELPRTKPPMT